jgi:uncharacterized protein
MYHRYLREQIIKDLKKKMVFLSGPRQVGKTTLAKSLLGGTKGYLNWDIPEDREAILKRELPATGFIVLDEIHKYSGWRNYLKGLYDKLKDSVQILVTGSARLEFYRYSGDSLQGRYHHLRLHPMSVAELGIESSKDLNELLTLGGFPEPFFSGSEIESRRWSREHRTLIIREEVRDLEQVTDLGKMELLSLRLPDLVGSPLSINALREDLQVSHTAVSKWIAVLERLYAIVRISPFGAPSIRAVKKEQKHYHYNWSIVSDEPKRFENLVALHLLKWVHFKQDTEGRNMELRYFRDIDMREVDFVITENLKPLQFIEVKWSDAPVSKSLLYLQKKFPGTEAYQIHCTGKKDYVTPEGIRVLPAVRFLLDLV